MAFGLAIPSATGCGSGSDTPPSTASGPSRCVVEHVKTAVPVPTGMVFTHVAQIDAEWVPGQQPRTLLEQPFSPSITWQQGRADEREVLAAVAANPNPLPTGIRDDRRSVAEFLQGVDQPQGVVVGYAAVTEVVANLTVDCADAAQVRGELRTWLAPDLGAVSCARPPEPSAPEAADKAFAGFCVADE